MTGDWCLQDPYRASKVQLVRSVLGACCTSRNQSAVELGERWRSTARADGGDKLVGENGAAITQVAVELDSLCSRLGGRQLAGGGKKTGECRSSSVRDNSGSGQGPRAREVGWANTR